MNFFRLSLLPLLLLFGSARSLECRTGFNTSFFSLPIEMWQETGCADNSVCFLSEISHDRTETLGQRVSISFGACLSKVYESQLECKNLFATGGLFPNQLISLIPDLQPQIYQLLTNLANKTSNSVLQYLSGGLNIQEGITEQILDRLNITIPNGFQSIVKRIDHVFIALFNNNETARFASLDALLNSFNSLIISDPPIAVYLEDYYQLYNLPIPDKYKPLISGSLSYIHQFLNQNEQFVLTQLLSSLSKPFQLYTNSVQPQVQKLMDVLNGFIPVAVRGNQQNIVEYALQGLGNFSYSTTESQVLGQEIISYIELFNITINVGIKELILGLPGIFNAALPNNGNLLASIFSNIANQLKTTRAIVESSAETAKETDLSKLIESILMMTGRNLTGLDRLYIRSSIFAAHKSLNETAQLDKFLLAVLEEFNGANDLGLVLKNTLSNLNITLSSQLDIFLDNLQPLVNILQGNSSAVSGIQCPSNSVTKAFATELNNELGRRGFHIPEIYRSLFECYPAILYNLLPNNAAIIDSIFTDAATAFSQNISTYLRSYFVKLQITLPDEFYSYIDSQQNVFDAAAQGNLSEVFGLLLRNIKDQSKVMELSKLVEKFLSSAGITETAEAQRIMAVINGFVRIATTGDRNSIAQYAFQALQNFSVSSNESQELGKAIVSYIEQFNVSLTPVLQGVIIRFPGLFNLIFPNKTEAVNQIFHSISVEFNKMNISDPFGYSLNLALRQLEMANILLPQETVIFITSLQDLYFALLKNDQSNIFQWMTDVLMGTYNETTNAANRLSESLKDVIEQITRKPIDENIGNLVDYSLRIPIKYFPENINLINMIYENITYHLQEANFTHYDSTSLDKIFNQIDISMLPAPLRLYINITRDLIKAVIANDTDKLMEIGREAFSKNCVTNNVTNSFVAALVNDLNARGVIIPGDISITLQCIPGIFYSASPNNIDVINSILQQATVSISLNATELLRSILSKANVTLPEQIFNNLVIQLEAIDSIARLNTTQGLTLLLESYKKLIKETELSKLIELMITQTGKNLSDNDLLNIRNSASSFYRSFPDKSATLDLFFSSIRNDLILGKELGLSLKNAFSLINVTIPANWDFILDNFGPIFKLALGNAASASNINCSTTPITGAFSSVLYNQLTRMDVNISDQYSHLFECFPAVFYASFPNETVRLDSIFALITSSISQNNSQTLQSILQMYNINIPLEIYDSVIRFIQIAASGDQNSIAQYVFQALQNFSVSSNESQELGKAIVSYIEQFNVSLTPVLQEVIIRFPGLFNLIFPNKTEAVNQIFHSISVEFNKMNISDPFGYSLNLALRQLEMANILLPQETVIFITSLQDLYFALLKNDQSNIFQWMTDVLMGTYNETTNAANRLSESLKDVIEQITRKPIDENIGNLVDYSLRIPIKYFPENINLINMIYENITYHLQEANFTHYDPTSLDKIFNQIDISMLPAPLRLYINITRDLIKAVIANDTDKLMEIGREAFSKNCVTNNVTNSFVAALVNDLNARGVIIPGDISITLQCIPGMFYSASPNNIDVINSILQQATVSISLNATELLRSILSKANVTLPEQIFDNLVIQLEAIDSIARLNTTQGLTLLLESYKKLIKETELSKLIELMITQTGKNLSDNDLLNIRNSASSFYRSFPDKSATLDLFFSSIRNDLILGKELGLSLKNAFSLINVTIPANWDFILDNFGPIFKLALGNAASASNINCSTTPITGAFSSVLYNQLIKMDVNISNQYSHLFECFPAVFYASFPNETVRLDSIFALITSSISQNNSQTLQSIFQMYNINIPQGVYDSVISQLDLLSALSRGNSTEIYQTWLDSYKKTAVETELSQLIEIILTKAGRNITDLDKLLIKNSAFSFYQGQSENKSQLDMLFSSIRSDFNSTSDWGLVIENALSNSNVTLPSQVNILLDNLQPIIYILAGNSSLVSGINCPSNSISKAFATDVTSELGKRGVHIPDQYKHVFECFPSVFYNVFPNNTALIDSIFTDVTSSLTQNISASFRSLFVKLGITLPGEFYTYVDSQQAVFSTLFQGNLSDVLVLLQGYFNNQSEVMDLSKHLETLLSNIGVMETSETHRITALIKGFIQAVASGDTNKFNETEVIKSIFQAYNVTIPAEFNLELSELTQAIREIISSSNATDLARKIRLLVAKFAPQNELSKFLVTVLTKSGASGDLIVLAKQIAAAAYTNLTDRFLNNLFSSLNTDIASGVDVGVAIRNALISVNLTVQREVDVLISNLQPLVNAIFAENTTAIPSVIQSILEAYATEFPEQTYYRLSTEMFALGFVLQTSNGLLTNEAIDTIVNIYNTILTTVNITQKNLTELLVSRFLPELEPYLFLINAVEPKDAVLLAVNFTTWLINPNRDAQMLFAALNRTIHTVYNRLNVDIREEIKSILNPELCRYGVCSTNLCNVQGLLRNITAVTSQPETTKSPPNLTNETTSQANIATQETTQTSTNTTTQPSTSNITVTSKMGLNAKNNFSWFTIVLTSLFAFIASLS